MRFRLFGLALLLSSALCLPAQSENRPLAAPLRPYAACKPIGGPDLVEVTPLISTDSVRTVQTLHGNAQVKLVDGARLIFSYRDTDPFANIKVEELADATYDQGKADLISNFDKLLSVDDNTTRNYALKPTLQGFEIYGLDRKALEGTNLGIYLLFDDKNHIATTVYFLNGDPKRRKFAAMEEYAGYRDQFLARYTACVRTRQTAPTTPPAPGPKKK